MPSSASRPLPAPLPALTRRGAVILLLVFAAIWFWDLDYRRLVHPDEGRYAEIPREMVASTDAIVARAVAAGGPLRTDVPFYTVRMYDQTLPHYLGRTVTQVEHDDELAMGIASEPTRAIAAEAKWLRRWNAGGQAYAIMEPDEFRRLREADTPMHELARDPRRVIVTRE